MRRWVVIAVVGAVVSATAVLWSLHSRTSVPLRHRVSTEDYLPGLGADLFVPDQAHSAPLVVLVPGGGWENADRSGLRPLADRLASNGIVAVTATYRAASDHVRFPVPVADIECAVDYAAARARRAGITPSRVLLLGHSAGAHLAMLAALTGTRFQQSCPYPTVQVAGVIGLAGPYDILTFQSLARSLFDASAAEDPTAWRDGNPVTWVKQRPQLPVLLAHGADDDTVSSTATTSFATLLRAAGHPVQLEIVAGADHASIYRPNVIADRILTWIRTLSPLEPRPPAPSSAASSATSSATASTRQ